MTLYFRSSIYIANLLLYCKFTLNLFPKIAFLVLKPYMQLKGKTSACILWATNLNSVVQFPYSLWYNSAVFKHKKVSLKGNMHTKYHWKISYHSLNIIKYQTCIL